MKKFQNTSYYQSQSSCPVGFGSVCIYLLSEDPGNFSHLGNPSQLLAAPKWGGGTGFALVRGTETQVRRNRNMFCHSFNGWSLFLTFSLPLLLTLSTFLLSAAKLLSPLKLESDWIFGLVLNSSDMFRIKTAEKKAHTCEPTKPFFKMRLWWDQCNCWQCLLEKSPEHF